MRNLATAAVLILLLAGWGPCSRMVRPDPIAAQCNPIGFEQCKSRARWEGDPEDPRAWDNLGGDTLKQSREETRTCELRRRALDECLQRLAKEKVIVL